MVELGRQPDEVADAVAIAVGERLDMELIEDGVFMYHSGSADLGIGMECSTRTGPGH